MEISPYFFGNILNISISTFVFRKIQKIFEVFFSYSMSDCYTSAVNAIITIFLAFAYFMTKSELISIIFINSITGFFISDLFTNVFTNNFTKFNFIMIIHHFISIYLMYFSKMSIFIKILTGFTMEFSNIPNYIVKSLLKYKAKKGIILFFKKIQLVFFCIFRILFAMPIIYYSLKDKNLNNFIILFISILFFFGIFWCYKLYKNIDKV
tara:strand:- start:158 stop:784 length:627 start_codon:yes stop_codon:yes gene_type:complete